MPRRDWLVLAILATIFAAEGFDVFLVGKIAPLIAHSFGVPPRALAGPFVLHQLGLAAGALAGGVAADRFGRKAVLVSSIGLAGLATLLVPMSQSVMALGLSRAVSGFFLGSGGASVVASASLIGGERYRTLAITTVLAGYSLGSSAGSWFALALVDGYGWRAGFGLAGIVLIGLTLPALVLLDARATSVEAPSAGRSLSSSERWLLGGLCGCFFLTMGLISLLSAWTASYFHELADVPVQRFATVGVLYAPAAILGMLGAGLAATRIALPKLACLTFGCHSAALLLMGIVAFGGGGFAACYFAAMLGQTSSQALLNIAVAQCFPAAARTTSFGAGAAAGRLGGIVTPWLGALALDFHLSLGVIFMLAALVPLASGLLLLTSLNMSLRTRL